MKPKSWRNIIILGAIMGSCFTAGVYAQDAVQRVDAYLRNDFNVVVNGAKTELKNKPLIYDGNSYLPVKELAAYLGSVVDWDSRTQTIYITSKINPQQADGQDVTYDEITLMNPYAYYMEYLGGTYPVLVMSYDKTYYRMKDILKMGIDTNGLRKAKEKYTQELYISEDELKKRWKETPSVSYVNEEPFIVIGEPDQHKRATLKKYVESNRDYMIGKDHHAENPIIMDALPQENEYEYLLMDNGHYFLTHLKIIKTSELTYTISVSSKEDIEAIVR